MAKTILVIEDDASVQAMLHDALVAAGFDVLKEADGERGLAAFEAHRPDLVLTDVLLPKLQGFDLIPKIRAIAPHVPIIVTSGVFRGRTYADEMKSRFAIHAYFDKPLDLDRLVEAVRTADDAPAVPRLADPKTDEPPLLPLELKGDVEDVSFGRIVGGLFARRATGALMLRRSSVKKIVYFVEGVPVFVKSNLLSECLGRVMVTERLITQEECDKSLLEKKRQTGKRQGEILVEMGSISQHNLEFALELQLQNKLFDIFGWRDGRYQFNPSTEPGGSRIPLSMGPTTLIHEGASREMTPERVLADMADLLPCPVFVSKERSFRYQALQLDPRAERMLDRIDGKRTLHDILASADFRKSDAAVVLYALVSTGLLRIALPVASASAGEVEVEALSTAEIEAIVARAKPPPPPPKEIVSTEVSAPPTAPEPGVSMGSDRRPAAPIEPSGLVRRADAPLPSDARATIDDDVPAVPRPEEDATAEARGRGDVDAEPEALPIPEAVEDDDEAEIFATVAAEDEAVEDEVAAEREEAAIAPVEPAAPADKPPRAPRSGLIPRARAIDPAAVSASSPAPDVSDLRATEDNEPLPRETSWSERIDEVTPRRSLPRASSLPRTGRWRRAEGDMTEEIPQAEAPYAPAMSDDIRRKVRERLEAQMEKLAETRRPAPRRPAPRRAPPKPTEEHRLDLEAERRRTEQELAMRYEQMQQQTWYELLRVPTDASVGAVREAYKHTAKRLDPDRAVLGTSSHAARMLAEKIYLLATRALTTLTSAEARLEYDRRLGIDSGPYIAAHFVADAAFERGKEALARDALDEAATEFHVAYESCPSEPLYIAYLAWVRYAMRSDDAEVREQTIEVLAKVLEDAPNAPEVLAYLGSVARKHGDKPNAKAAYQRLLAIDPDHPVALAAMRELSPPPEKKGGLLSRYFAG